MLTITICLCIFLFASSASGKNNPHRGLDTSYSPSINQNLLSKITLWNSLNISNHYKQGLFFRKGTPDRDNSGPFVDNKQSFHFGPSDIFTKQLSTQKFPLKQGFEQRQIQGTDSSQQIFPENGFNISPYFLLSKVRNNYQLPPFWKAKTNAPQRKATERIYWMGGSLSGSILGPLNMQVHSLYGTNNFQQDKDYYRSWLTDFGLEYQMEKITPVFHVFYSSENQDNRFLEGEDLLSFDLQQQAKAFPHWKDSVPTESKSQFSKKNIGIQVGAKDLNLLKRLNNSFNLFYAKNIYYNQYEDQNNTSQIDHTESIQEARMQSMWGVDLSSYYNLYENLSVGLYFSYTASYPAEENDSDNTGISEIHSDLNFEF